MGTARRDEVLSSDLETGVLDEMDSRSFLERHGIEFNRAVVVEARSGIGRALDVLPPPVVMKVVSADIVHKSDAGCVIVGLDSQAEAEQAFDLINSRALSITSADRIRGVSVHEMIDGAAEAFIGAKWSELFGPVLTIGTGGVFVELLNDIAIRLCPVERGDVMDMVDELRLADLIKGFRGRARGDLDAFVELAVKVSTAVSTGEIAEVDLNPVVIRKTNYGAVPVDARVRLRP